jgi:hypothetical protein
MLVGQDERFLSAVVVVSPTALANAGLISSSEGKQLAKLLGPTPLTTGCVGTQAELDAGNALIDTKAIKVCVHMYYNTSTHIQTCDILLMCCEITHDYCLCAHYTSYHCFQQQLS